MSGSEKRRRGEQVNVRLTKGGLSDLDRAAHAMGISVAELLRVSFASGSPIAVRTQHARAIYNEGHSKGLVEGAEAIRALFAPGGDYEVCPTEDPYPGSPDGRCAHTECEIGRAVLAVLDQPTEENTHVH